MRKPLDENHLQSLSDSQVNRKASDVQKVPHERQRDLLQAAGARRVRGNLPQPQPNVVPVARSTLQEALFDHGKENAMAGGDREPGPLTDFHWGKFFGSMVKGTEDSYNSGQYGSPVATAHL